MLHEKKENGLKPSQNLILTFFKKAQNKFTQKVYSQSHYYFVWLLFELLQNYSDISD